MKQSIAVFGAGFVGKNLSLVLIERGVSVYNYDRANVFVEGSEQVDYSSCLDVSSDNVLHEAKVSKFIKTCEQDKTFSGIYFVCLPTPMKKTGECDLSIIESMLDLLVRENDDSRTRIAVIKSTVPPGSCEKWNELYNEKNLFIVHNPEFLTEANALNDMRNQDRIILGGPRPYINNVKQIFEFAFPNVKIIKTSSTTSEMVKYVTNIHLAVKVSLANEFYQICQALDNEGKNIDYDKVIEYATLDKRLGNSHWKVPGPMPSDATGLPSLGFGGSCFVKDIRALIYLSEQLNIDPKVMQGAWDKNVEVRPNRDWEKLVGRAVSSCK